MSETYTFQDVNKKFTLTTKTEFLTKCPNPHEHSDYDLNSKFHMFTFLHNPSGPAVIRHRDERRSYWLEGKCLEKENPELAEKMKHNDSFNKKLMDSLNE